MFGLIISTWALVGVVAAAEEVPQPRFSAVVEDDIMTARLETYMKTKVAVAKLRAQYAFEFPYLTFVQDFRVTTVGLFDNFAQLDDFRRNMAALNEKTGGKSKQLDTQIAPCIRRTSSSINLTRSDLTYLPKEPTFLHDFSQPYYLSVDIYHIKPGKYDEAQSLAKKFKEFSEKKDSPNAYFVYERIIGQDKSAFIVVASAKDKAAFVKREKEIQDDSDPEFLKMRAEISRVLTKIERKEGTFVPDASYVPYGTFE